VWAGGKDIPVSSGVSATVGGHALRKLNALGSTSSSVWLTKSRLVPQQVRQLLQSVQSEKQTCILLQSLTSLVSPCVDYALIEFAGKLKELASARAADFSKKPLI
jgi:hypothetical protein